MHGYANLLMERELFALGKHVIKLCPNKEDRYIISNVVFHQYGRYYMFARKPKEAVKWYEKALKYIVAYEPYDILKGLAAAYIETGQYGKVDQCIQRCLAYKVAHGHSKRYDQDKIQFAKFYLETKRYERAIALMLEAHPDDRWYRDEKLDLAVAYLGIGETEKAFEIYEEYLRQYPDDDYVVE